MADDYVEAGSHPEDHETAMELGLSKKANDGNYDGQSIGLEAGPDYDVQGYAEPEQGDKSQGLLDEDEAEGNDGIDVIR
ncbi:MAG: hypothetical protein ABEJ66_02745 [Candidatus Nanohaloarchaea archaeon]